MATADRDPIQRSECVPRLSLRNGQRMTLSSWGNPRSFPRLPAPARRDFDVAPETRVVADESTN